MFSFIISFISFSVSLGVLILSLISCPLVFVFIVSACISGARCSNGTLFSASGIFISSFSCVSFSSFFVSWVVRFYLVCYLV